MAWRVDPPIIELILNNPISQIESELKKNNNAINSLDNTARTALHYCILPEEGTVKYDRGLDHETIFDNGDSCNYRKLKSWDQVEWLDLNKPSLEVLKTWPKRLAVAYLLCQYGANVNVTDQPKGGLPLLSACAQRGDLLLIQLLIRYGADTSACKNLAELAYNRGHHLCAAYIDKHSLSLKSQCRGTLRVKGINQNNLSELPVPCSVKLFLNYNLHFTGYVEKLIPLRTFTDEDIIKGKVSVDDVIKFLRKYATERFCETHKGILFRATPTIEKDLVRLMHILYSEDCFHELKYEEPLAIRPRYSMEPVSEERMKHLGLYREEKKQKATERFKFFTK